MKAKALAEAFADAEGDDATGLAARTFVDFYKSRAVMTDDPLMWAARYDASKAPVWHWPAMFQTPGAVPRVGRYAYLKFWYATLQDVLTDMEEYVRLDSNEAAPKTAKRKHASKRKPKATKLKVTLGDLTGLSVRDGELVAT